MIDLKKWKLLQSKLVINNQWCQVRQDEVELPNGTIINDFFINVRPDIAIPKWFVPGKSLEHN